MQSLDNLLETLESPQVDEPTEDASSSEGTAAHPVGSESEAASGAGSAKPSNGGRTEAGVMEQQQQRAPRFQGFVGELH